MFLLNKNSVEFCKSCIFRDSQFAREGDNLVVSHNVFKYLGYIINKRGKKIPNLFQRLEYEIFHCPCLNAGQIWTHWKHGWLMLSGGTSALLYLLYEGGSVCGVTPGPSPSSLSHELGSSLCLTLQPNSSGLVRCVVRAAWETCLALAFCAPLRVNARCSSSGQLLKSVVIITIVTSYAVSMPLRL